MKKILFVVPHMLCAGVEKALLNFIEVIKNDNIEITILMLKEEGEFLELIPNDVISGEIPFNTEDIRNSFFEAKQSKKYLIEYIKSGNFIKVISRIYKEKIKGDYFAGYKYSFDFVENLKCKYDIAICYHIHVPFLIRYISDKVDATYKIAWIHNDFSTTGYPILKFKKYLLNFNKIYAVSSQLKDEFIGLIPELLPKTEVFYNIVSKELIEKQASKYIPSEYDKEYFNILTIGRLEYQKGYDLAIKVCKMLKESNIKIKWFILGEGKLLEELKILVEQLELEECFIFLGIRMNPYPYIKHCNLYVQSSRHEGNPVAMTEARLLNKGIICTNFAGAKDQINDGINGKIVNFNENELYDSIKQYIENPLMLKMFEKEIEKQRDDEYFERINRFKMLFEI